MKYGPEREGEALKPGPERTQRQGKDTCDLPAYARGVLVPGGNH